MSWSGNIVARSEVGRWSGVLLAVFFGSDKSLSDNGYHFTYGAVIKAA